MRAVAVGAAGVEWQHRGGALPVEINVKPTWDRTDPSYRRPLQLDRSRVST
jgi:hypothetical protein